MVARFRHTCRHRTIIKLERHYQILSRSHTGPVVITVRTMLQRQKVTVDTAHGQLTELTGPDLLVVVGSHDLVPLVGTLGVDTATAVDQGINA